MKRFKEAVDLTKEQLELEKQLTEAKVLSNKKSTPKESEILVGYYSL